MLALIAGTGALPHVLFTKLSAQGTVPVVCAMAGFVPEIAPNVTFRIEHLGRFLKDLQDKGITHICMAGAVRRPDIEPDEIDSLTLPLIPRLQIAMEKGDDGALRGIIELMEEHGFVVVGAAELVPELLPPAGVLSQAVPTDADRIDASVGDTVMQELGAGDIGQACIIAKGQVVAREGADGTDAMIHDHKRGGGILFKAPKPGQDRRADLPVIGPQTARNAAASGLRGIVIEDGGVMVLDLPEVRRILDGAGLFLWVREWD